MQIWESIRVALTAIVANKLRSALTMLGIIIGVGAVIALMSIGRGAQASITDQISSIGTNLVFVRPGAVNQGGVRTAQGAAATLTYDDALALQNVSNIAAVAPEFGTGGQVIYQGQNVNTRITGVTPEYLDVRNYVLADGENITQSQLQGRSTVAILGANIATTLFGDAPPIGQSIRVNNVPFRVIGVLVAKGGNGIGSQDDLILVPLTTALTRLSRGGQFRGATVVSSINVQVADAASIDPAIQEISDILRQRHHVLYEDDFSVSSQRDALTTLTQVTGVLTAFLGGIAAISLIVGGIGIMNIMLVSVTERTREIGLRKALGAKRQDLLTQFLTEATILSLAGGLIGIAIGIGVSRLIQNFNFNTVVGLDSVILATLFSIAVGLFFGIYPASRAASLNPIEALRYE
ncbi:MAG: FtsX-like permease family protein [Chloroflexi bacterium]|nr:FtsX-like permease family protein [Chloroflexota bacterium]